MTTRTLLAILALALVLTACAKGASGTPQPAVTSTPFIDLSLATPPDTKDADYLGISQQDAFFQLSDIKSPYLLIQVFSAYCPHCQAEAPHMVELFDMIQKAGLGDKLKVVGIGPNNNDFEVKLFRDKYHIPFPLIPDPDMQALEGLGRTPTPTYLILQLNGQGAQPGLLAKEVGRFSSAKDFFALLRETTAL